MSEVLIGRGNVFSVKGERRSFIGGSDARIIMGDNEAALVNLWREKRGEVEPEDLSGNLIVQLGSATEELNRRWYEANTGQVITDVQRQVRHPTVRWMGATLDGRVDQLGRFSRQNSCGLSPFARSRHEGQGFSWQRETLSPALPTILAICRSARHTTRQQRWTAP